MIIAKIETFPLRIPFKPNTRAAASAWGDKGLPVADSLLVKVTTDQGLEGWGEAFGFRAVRSAKLAVEELIAPICIGKDATKIAPLMLEVQEKLHIFGRTGPLFYGISAVDIALWDIAGKAANAPVYRLLGGGAADLDCYASLIRYSDPSLVRANVRCALDAGFRHLYELSDRIEPTDPGRKVAWIGIYQPWLAFITVIVSACVLPLIAASLAGYRLRLSGHPHLQNLTMATAIGASALLAISTSHKLYSLRGRTRIAAPLVAEVPSDPPAQGRCPDNDARET